MHQRRLAEFNRVIESFYARAAEGEAWDVAALHRYLATDLCHILTINCGGIIVEGASSGVSAAEVEHYIRNWAARDEIGPKLFARSPGRALTDEALMSREEFEGSAVFEGFYEPGGVTHFAVGYLPVGPQLNCGISVQNGRGTGPIRPETLRDLDTVIPHLRRAMALRWRIAEVRRASEASSGLLSNWGLGLIQCDRSGLITALQGEAEALLAGSGAMVRCASGRLRLADEGADRRLAMLLRDPGAALLHAGATLYLDDPCGACGLELTVLPFEGNGVPEGLRLVLCRRTGEASSIDRRYLRRRFRITPGEADVLAHLLDGRTLAEIAAARGSTIGTIRSYVKQLRRKLHCSNQAQLVSLGWQAIGLHRPG
ncbi:DNA-binding CsgD family transcriptional regulator [Natronocella acetinitrilica]|uniref:DNA-binding CsgD family transcriptional regulator n=1 Tax=Natronocella acetinitrilica TaxID=414046 RepID=A0AAE3G3J8_9GAMM|nr:helix-turn-helix transcriptional regulator [Natronocella acetinitrilica]MCP1674414.1 DNA-binding CsgD family transcriptional regulator [Natronocella acetinitrilica]